MKIHKDQARVKNIEQSNERTLKIQWTDDKESKFDVVRLRELCPCASCVNEMTGVRTIKPEDVADSIRPVQITSVGRYALNIQFTDMHSSGIYTFEYLRELGAN